MTCRHAPGDRSCSKYDTYTAPPPATPDKKKYSIEDAARVGLHLVLRVKYPNCASCKFEGNKVMVFLNITELDALKWKEIDPHFRDNKVRSTLSQNAAPSPAARFPGNEEGWQDALDYAARKGVTSETR